MQSRFEKVKNIPVDQLTPKQQHEIIMIAKKNILLNFDGMVSRDRLNEVSKRILMIDENQVREYCGAGYQPGIMGFYSRKDDKLRVNLSRHRSVGEMLATIDHEMMHALSQRLDINGSGIGMIGGLQSNGAYVSFNEGVTEMISIENMKTVYPDYASRSYVREVSIVRRYSGIIGADRLKKLISATMSAH